MNRFDPDHYYYGPHGEKITLEEWGHRFEQDRTLREDDIGDDIKIKTVYLGFVDMNIPGARLYGTARIDPDLMTVDLYDSEHEARAGHDTHRQAIQDGFHCHNCRVGQRHPH